MDITLTINCTRKFVGEILNKIDKISTTVWVRRRLRDLEEK